MKDEEKKRLNDSFAQLQEIIEQGRLIKGNSFLQVRDGILMDEKAADDYDYAHGEEMAEKYANRERNKG